MPDWRAIASQLESAGRRVSLDMPPRTVSGGDISAAWRMSGSDGDVFVKTGPSTAAEQFSAEADGLSEIAASHTICVPHVLATGLAGEGAFLALDWLEFVPADATTETLLGEHIAAMHACSAARFGWHRDNTIGLTPQCNQQCDDWAEFFREYRLRYQLQLAAKNGYQGTLQTRGEQLLQCLPKYFDSEAHKASLLHGDLWGGNWRCVGGQPVVFDPAVYYGDRESDIAMTRLFGGFGRGFYEAYHAHWPRRDGHADRECLYQLYHVLNHLNLFGSSYLGRAVALIDQLL